MSNFSIKANRMILVGAFVDVLLVEGSRTKLYNPFSVIMISFAQWAHRNWRSFRPVESAKSSNAVRIGLIGASKIAYAEIQYVGNGCGTAQDELTMASQTYRRHNPR